MADTVAVSMLPLTGKDIYDRLCKATRDRGARATWWNQVVHAFRRSGQLHVLDDHLQYVESERGGGIQAPSRYMVKRVLASARELSIKVPELPGAASKKKEGS